MVQLKELIPLFHDVILWMLKRDLLVTLHLRIRIVATRDLKIRVRLRKRVKRNQVEASENGRKDSGHPTWLSLSLQSARRYSRRVSSVESHTSELSELNLKDDPDDGEPSISEDSDSTPDAAEDDSTPSMINDPSSATPLQRQWLSAMSEGKDADIAQRFEQ